MTRTADGRVVLTSADLHRWDFVPVMDWWRCRDCDARVTLEEWVRYAPELEQSEPSHLYLHLAKLLADRDRQSR